MALPAAPPLHNHLRVQRRVVGLLCRRRPHKMGRGTAGPLRSLVLAALCLCAVQAAFNRSDWTLPTGFNIELYAGSSGSVPNARSLALSGASKLTGPWITYVSAMSFGGQPMNVSGRSCLRPATVQFGDQLQLPAAAPADGTHDTPMCGGGAFRQTVLCPLALLLL